MALRQSRQRAFTLLEVLVAMAIFAIIGLGANEMLRTIIHTHNRARQITDMFNQLSMAFVVMGRDVSEIVPREVRDENGQYLAPLMVGTGNYAMQFTRTGWNDPAGLPRSDMQRVAYQLTDKGVLQRVIWLALDRAPDSKPIVQTLLTGVTDFSVSLVKKDGTSTTQWPESAPAANQQSATAMASELAASGAKNNAAPVSPDKLPLAVEVTIDTKAMGEVRRVFALVSNPAQFAPPGGTAGNNNSVNLPNVTLPGAPQ